MVIAMLAILYNVIAENKVSTVQRTEAKENKNVFLRIVK